MLEELTIQLQPVIISAAITVLTTIGAWVGATVRAWLKEKINTETKKNVVETTCAYVQQVYKHLDGESKFEKAREAIVEQLALKGITITELELRVLIEATVNGFKQGFNAEPLVDEEPVEGTTTETDQLVNEEVDFEVEGVVDPEIDILEDVEQDVENLIGE